MGNIQARYAGTLGLPLVRYIFVLFSQLDYILHADTNKCFLYRSMLFVVKAVIVRFVLVRSDNRNYR